MKDRASNMTTNKVKTSIVSTGHHPPLCTTRGHLTLELHPFPVRLYVRIISCRERLFNIKFHLYGKKFSVIKGEKMVKKNLNFFEKSTCIFSQVVI